MEPQELDPYIFKLLKDKNPFKVPGSYFENVYPCMHTLFNEEAVPSILQDKDPDVFVTPLHYFDGLSDQIMDRIEKQKLEQIGMTNSNLFSVPEEYFDKLSDRVTENVQRSKPKRVGFKFQSIVKYALAACVLSALTFMIFRFTGETTQVSQDVFANISEEDLLAYVQENAAEYDLNSLSGLLSEEEIEALSADEEMDDNEIEELIEEFL